MFDYSLDNENVLTLAPKELGDSYNVALEATLTTNPLIKRALVDYWQATYDDFYNKPITDEIEIDIVGSISDTSGQKLKL